MNTSLSKFIPVALCAVTLSLGASAVYAQGASNEQAIKAVSNALPQGKTLATASKAELIAAIKKALSNPSTLGNPQLFTDAVGAIASQLSLAQLPLLGEAVGQLIQANPALASAAPALATAIAKAGATKEGSPDARGTAVGSAVSALATYLDPTKPENAPAIVQLIVKTIEVDQALDYTAAVYQVFNRTLTDLGAPAELIVEIERGVLAAVPDPQIQRQIAERVAATAFINKPSNLGNIIITETPKDAQ